jgi:hypothetical protein
MRPGAPNCMIIQPEFKKTKDFSDQSASIGDYLSTKSMKHEKSHARESHKSPPRMA